MPMSKSFKERLLPIAEQLVEHYGTPFHIYDEAGIRETGENLKKRFPELKDFVSIMLSKHCLIPVFLN